MKIQAFDAKNTKKFNDFIAKKISLLEFFTDLQSYDLIIS